MSARSAVPLLALLLACRVGTADSTPDGGPGDAGIPASTDSPGPALEERNGPRRDGLYNDPSQTAVVAAGFHPYPPLP